METHPAAVVDSESIDPVVLNNPLERYSLLGRADEIEALATEAKPLLGNVVLAGQSTIIYAKPNTGKTLITLWLVMEAIKAGRIQAGNVYYLNADDSSSGVAAKARMFEELGAHTLVPGHRNFEASQLLELMQTMAASGKCRGVLIIVDTLNKAINLMDKNVQRTFGKAVRACVVHGATFVGLAHTNKNSNTLGKEVYGGTSDMLEDSDAACVLSPLKNFTPVADKVAHFDFMKRRGDNANEAYAFAAGGTESYDELMASVRLVDPENLDELMAEAEQRTDEPVIEAVSAAIRDGVTQKMKLRDEVSKRAKVSTHVAVQVTGMRVSELLSARWEHLDAGRRTLFVPTSKTGRSRHVPLSVAALEIVAELPREEGTAWLFPNPADPSRHLTTIKHAFQSARSAAGMPGLRIHDLRHSAASAMVAAGVDLFAVGKVLDHASYVDPALRPPEERRAARRRRGGRGDARDERLTSARARAPPLGCRCRGRGFCFRLIFSPRSALRSCARPRLRITAPRKLVLVPTS